MNKCTLITESVREYIAKYFVFVKYESSIDAEQFMRFDIMAKPAIIVLDSTGNEIFSKIGFFKPGIFIEQLEKTRKKAARKVAVSGAV